MIKDIIAFMFPTWHDAVAFGILFVVCLLCVGIGWVFGSIDPIPGLVAKDDETKED